MRLTSDKRTAHVQVCILLVTQNLDTVYKGKNIPALQEKKINKSFFKLFRLKREI
jgi:hypothetical protein